MVPTEARIGSVESARTRNASMARGPSTTRATSGPAGPVLTWMSFDVSARPWHGLTRLRPIASAPWSRRHRNLNSVTWP